MKSLSFVFLVLVFFLTIHINGDIQERSLLQSSSPNDTEIFKFNQLINETFTDIDHLYMNPLINNEERGRLCLEHLDQCYDEDHDYGIIANRLLKLLLKSSSIPFDFKEIPDVSQKCKQQSQRYIEDLHKFKLWALKMYDSSAKVSSGILSGNINQFGDFDMCLGVNSPENSIKGQYCLTAVQIDSFSSPYMAALQRLVQSHYHFKSRLDDPGHRVPRFSSINWALCVPDACTPTDVQLAIVKKLQNFFKNTDVHFDVRVEPQMCQTGGGNTADLPQSTIIAIGVFTAMSIIVIAAAIYDYTAVGDKNKWIMAFSLRRNLNSMLSIARSSDDIEAIHGVRFLNSFMLLGAHKSMALFFVPYTNRTEMVEYISKPWTVIGRAASLYTDPFIMISGTLTAYSLFGKLQRNKRINIIEEYYSRLLRIVPTFAALIAFCTLILPWLNRGPLWNLVVLEHSQICKEYWWRNLLFIHNYFGFKNICLTHTHHVGIDTQLFFISPILILILWKWPKKGGVFLISLAIISTIMRYYVTYTLKLSNYIHFGTSIQQLFDTADNMYILPAHRITVYIMGIFLGYILRKYKTITLSKTQVHIGDTIALFSFFVSFLGPSFMGVLNYQYHPTDAAWYAAFAPILWCFSFAWIIFTTHIGYKGAVGRFFSRPAFQIWTKISYTVYLTQFPVFFYNLGTLRTAEHYGFFRMMLNLKELVWIILLSCILTLLFESPFQNLRNLIVKKEQSHNKIKCN